MLVHIALGFAAHLKSNCRKKKKKDASLVKLLSHAIIPPKILIHIYPILTLCKCAVILRALYILHARDECFIGTRCIFNYSNEKCKSIRVRQFQ